MFELFELMSNHICYHASRCLGQAPMHVCLSTWLMIFGQQVHKGCLYVHCTLDINCMYTFVRRMLLQWPFEMGASCDEVRYSPSIWKINTMILTCSHAQITLVCIHAHTSLSHTYTCTCSSYMYMTLYMTLYMTRCMVECSTYTPISVT